MQDGFPQIHSPAVWGRRVYKRFARIVIHLRNSRAVAKSKAVIVSVVSERVDIFFAQNVPAEVKFAVVDAELS